VKEVPTKILVQAILTPHSVDHEYHKSVVRLPPCTIISTSSRAPNTWAIHPLISVLACFSDEIALSLMFNRPSIPQILTMHQLSGVVGQYSSPGSADYTSYIEYLVYFHECMNRCESSQRVETPTNYHSCGTTSFSGSMSSGGLKGGCNALTGHSWG
jgi:hypothetical protein